MIYTLRFTHRAAAYFDRLDRPTKDRVELALTEIARNPFGSNTKQLANAGLRRSTQVGDYRIIFAFDAAAGVVDILSIGPRGQVYRGV